VHAATQRNAKFVSKENDSKNPLPNDLDSIGMPTAHFSRAFNVVPFAGLMRFIADHADDKSSSLDTCKNKRSQTGCLGE
jgi:hypothetical protein